MTVMTKPNKRDVKKSTNPVTVEAIEEAVAAAEPTVNPPLFLGDLSYRELQVLAKERGLKASGTKAALIERLGG